MNAPATIEQADELLTFFPDIHGEEYELRVKMRSLRNTASAMIGRTESGTARQLAWIMTEYVTQAIYEPMNEAALADLNKFFHRLLLTALQAERIDLLGAGA